MGTLQKTMGYLKASKFPRREREVVNRDKNRQRACDEGAGDGTGQKMR